MRPPAFLLSLLLLLTRPAGAEPLAPVVEGAVLPPGSFTVGLVSPVRIGLDGFLELDTQLVSWLMLSPNLQLRMQLCRCRYLDLAGIVALGTPTPAMRLLKGYLFPSWEASSRNVGWFVVPEVGVAASAGEAELVLTARATLAVGIGVGPNDAGSLDTYAPVELLFAPALNGYRTTLSLTADYGLLRWLRVRGEAAVHVIGEGDAPRSPWIFDFEVGAEARIWRGLRVYLGLAVFNFDQHANELRVTPEGRWERVGVRSTDVHPSFDLFWVH